MAAVPYVSIWRFLISPSVCLYFCLSWLQCHDFLLFIYYLSICYFILHRHRPNINLHMHTQDLLTCISCKCIFFSSFNLCCAFGGPPCLHVFDYLSWPPCQLCVWLYIMAAMPWLSFYLLCFYLSIVFLSLIHLFILFLIFLSIYFSPLYVCLVREKCFVFRWLPCLSLWLSVMAAVYPYYPTI